MNIGSVVDVTVLLTTFGPDGLDASVLGIDVKVLA